MSRGPIVSVPPKDIMKREEQQKTPQVRKQKFAAHEADHRAIAWPVMLKFIDDNQMGSCRVLDYHCGTGDFCRRMRSEGLLVEGMVASADDMRTAMKQSSAKIRYYEENPETLKEMDGRYDVITSMMNFHFLEDFESRLPLLRGLLRERGIVVFAVYNPEYVESCHRAKVVFRSLRTVSKTSVARMQGKHRLIDTYVRSKEDYRRLFEKHGFEYLSSRYPPFTSEFLEQNRWKLPAEDAEYLIMVMRKT